MIQTPPSNDLWNLNGRFLEIQGDNPRIDPANEDNPGNINASNEVLRNDFSCTWTSSNVPIWNPDVDNLDNLRSCAKFQLLRDFEILLYISLIQGNAYIINIGDGGHDNFRVNLLAGNRNTGKMIKKESGTGNLDKIRVIGINGSPALKLVPRLDLQYLKF